MTSTRYITLANENQMKRAALALADACPIMRTIHARTGTPPLRDFSADVSGLAKIIMGQQLSIASAAAIWSRLSAAIQPFEAERILAIDDTGLAALGLSRPKIRTLKAVAAAIHNDGFDISRLSRVADADVIAQLTALHGVGPWTADIYLLFALRRADAFPAGDLALQLAAQRLLKLDDKPSPASLIEIAERWRPWRGAAARLLWAEYGLYRTEQKAGRSRASGIAKPATNLRQPRKSADKSKSNA